MFDLPLRQCGFGLIYGHDVIRRVDAQQFLALGEHASGNIFRRNTDDGSRDFRAQNGLGARANGALARNAEGRG
jgi:hypothetical protein